MSSQQGYQVSLAGKTALVTGASRGIGRSICLALCKAGADVVINYRTQSEAAEETRELASGLGGTVTPVKFDVSDPESVDKGVTEILEKTGRLDILVNNAGITRDGLLARMKDEDWNQVLNTNLSGVFYVCRSVGKTMIRNRSGRIVNIASAAGQMGNAGQVNYSAAKAGLIGFTKAMARELAPRNILVNAVSPGIMAEGLTEKLTEKQLDEIRAHVPLRRVGKAEDVAAAVLFLCSEMADYITGQVIGVNGGLCM